MGKPKAKTRKFAEVKRMLKPSVVKGCARSSCAGRLVTSAAEQPHRRQGKVQKPAHKEDEVRHV